MRKDVNNIVVTYVKNLSDFDLSELYDRLTKGYQDDLAESLKMIQRSSEMDKWLSTSKNASDLFRMVDIIHAQIKEEMSERGALV